jgi:uncharacterized protein YqiB (DUF1249 family)
MQLNYKKHVTNTKKIKLYVLTYEYPSILKKNLKETKHQFMMFLNKWMNAFHMKNSQQIWKNLMMNKDSL